MNTENTKSAAALPPLGVDPEFFLWHLQNLGIVGPNFETTLWDNTLNSDGAPKKEIVVAIIDNGCDIGHPNLADAIEAADVLDFSSHLYGTSYELVQKSGNHKQKTAGEPFADLATALKKLGIGLTGDLAKIATELKGKEAVKLPIESPSRFFASHGTACAGLIGGRPGTPTTVDKVLPYCGVNPWCTILPICTPYSHEVLPVIHALLYAVAKGADIILMPRGIDHIGDRAGVPGMQQNGSRIETNMTEFDGTKENVGIPVRKSDQANRYRLAKDLAAFEDLIQKLSEKIFVVMAAGNDGRPDALSYPGSLIGEKRVSRPPWKGKTTKKCGKKLIVVTAENANGKPSSYSNGSNITNVNLLPMLSDDASVVRDGMVRIDTDTQFSDDYGFKAHEGAEENTDYSPWGILSLDVCGSYGYESGQTANPKEYGVDHDRQSLYTVFGGTSAASALVAGMISLLLQMGDVSKIPDDKAQLKAVFDNWKKGIY